MTTEQQNFLATIRAAPDDDTARLAYADWLDEREPVRVPCPATCEEGFVYASRKVDGDDQWSCSTCGRYSNMYGHTTAERATGCRKPCQTCKGTGTVLDADARDRAAMIRVQVELSRLRHDNDSETHRINKLSTRAYALLFAHPEWKPACPVCEGVPFRSTNDTEVEFPYCTGLGRVGEFRRGLLEVVRVPTMATVWEWKVLQSNIGRHEEWEPTAWARDHLGPHLTTVREVWCAYGEPTESTTGWWWASLRAAVPHQHRTCLVPEPVFQCMVDRPTQMLTRSYPTPDDARLALAVGVADSLRKVCVK